MDYDSFNGLLITLGAWDVVLRNGSAVLEWVRAASCRAPSAEAEVGGSELEVGSCRSRSAGGPARRGMGRGTPIGRAASELRSHWSERGEGEPLSPPLLIGRPRLNTRYLFLMCETQVRINEYNRFLLMSGFSVSRERGPFEK